jgi:hypothetical protein
MSPGIRPRTAGAAPRPLPATLHPARFARPRVPSDHSCPPARRAWLHRFADHCLEFSVKRRSGCRPFGRRRIWSASLGRPARISRGQARRAGGAGSGPRRRRRAPRASALGRQRVGTGARDRSSGRVRTRKPSVPWTREAGPLACGRRGTSPRKPVRSRAPLFRMAALTASGRG